MAPIKLIRILVGIQLVYVLAIGCFYAIKLTGMSFVASLIFGGLPAAVLYNTLVGAFPRAMAAASALLWAVVGYDYAGSLGAGWDTTLAVVVVSGLLGVVASYGPELLAGPAPQPIAAPQAQPAPDLRRTAQDAAVPRRTPVPDLEGSDRWQLAHGLDHLLRARAIRSSTFSRAASFLDPDDFRTAPDAIDMARLEREEITPRSLLYVTLLDEAGLLTEGDADSATAVIETQIDDLPDAQHDRLARSAAQDEEACRDRHLLRLSRRGGALPSLADHLHHLAGCRAISMTTFRRAIVEVDPGYDLAQARIANFPLGRATSDSARQAEALLEAGLLTRHECDMALAAIGRGLSAA